MFGGASGAALYREAAAHTTKSGIVLSHQAGQPASGGSTVSEDDGREVTKAGIILMGNYVPTPVEKAEEVEYNVIYDRDSGEWKLYKLRKGNFEPTQSLSLRVIPQLDILGEANGRVYLRACSITEFKRTRAYCIHYDENTPRKLPVKLFDGTGAEGDFYAYDIDGVIYRFDQNNTSTKIATTIKEVKSYDTLDMCYYEGYLYYSIIFDGIFRLRLDGSEHQEIYASKRFSRMKPDFKNGCIYIEDFLGERIDSKYYRISLDGSKCQEVPASLYEENGTEKVTHKIIVRA